jgi:VIT1/CCC1 family predicted Fe2+/Mn2+ transporter/rubrerythrin
MDAPVLAPPSDTPSDRPQADESWDEHYRDERDAAYLYRALAAVETNAERKELFEKLAVVEDRHAERWEALFAESGRPLPPYKTAQRTKLLAWVAKHFGTSPILPLMLAEEGREVQAYLGMARHSSHRQTHQAAVEIASDSAVHARELAQMMGREGEPWHVGGSGGYLRSVVYGFNDGLTANFGLVAGVLGASVAPHVVIISGVAGALADALSMGSSGYLAAKSEAEVQAHQIDLERHEMRLMPDLEEEELALIYQAKGLSAERARETARAMMQDPSLALDAMVREELNIHPAELAPLKDGIVTGGSTAIGAFIPIFPFFVLDHWTAVWTSLAISMLTHFGIGAARSIFTGRSVWASGRDMFLVGFGVAAIGYVIGDWVTRLL